MGVKLYYGGFGDYQEFTVAEDEPDAIKKIGEKINAPFLPITVKEISKIDGFKICAHETGYASGPLGEPGVPGVIPGVPDVTFRHCKKCDFTCENQGELLAHYREKHPKGD